MNVDINPPLLHSVWIRLLDLLQFNVNLTKLNLVLLSVSHIIFYQWSR